MTATQPPAVRRTMRCRRCGELLTRGQPAGPCVRCGALAAGRPRAGPGPLAAFLRGFDACVRGALFVARHPRLWTWIMVPLLVNAAVCAALILVGWALLAPLVPDFATQDWGWFDAWRAWIAPLLRFLVLAVTVLAALLLTLLLAGLVNAPFHDLLSEQVEAAALKRPAPSRPLSAWLPDGASALAAASYLAARQILFLGLLFIFSLTGFAAPLFPIAGFWFAGYAQIDVTLSRKRYRAGERIAWARRHRALVFGLGLPVALLPPLQPFGIVGATLLYLDDEDKA
jgi:CysZ protein